MKRLILALVLTAVMGAGTVVQAEGKCGMCAMKMDPDKKMQKLNMTLDLTEKQKEQVKQLVDAKHKKLQPVMDQMESAMKTAKDDFDAGMKKILNDKQQAKFKEMQDMKKHECGH
jgi:hypothetical protein